MMHVQDNSKNLVFLSNTIVECDQLTPDNMPVSWVRYVRGLGAGPIKSR
jgi:hypothetical protein